MEEALSLVNEAVERARSLKLESTLHVSLQRSIGDNQLTFNVAVPPEEYPTHRQVARPKGTEDRRVDKLMPLGARSNTDLDAVALAGGILSDRRESLLSDSTPNDDVARLMAEIERLKRKALSRGVNLTSKDEDVPAEDVARLRTVFALADNTGSGFINKQQLQALHLALGEPLTDDEAHDAFKRMDVNKTGTLDFDDFLSWFTLAHSRSGLLSKKGQAYSRRFKKLMARIEGAFDLKGLSSSETGEVGTLGYRINFHYNDNGVLKRISPWHDIPLFANDGNVHFICEVRAGPTSRPPNRAMYADTYSAHVCGNPP